MNLYGKPKTGKSFASMGMGLAIANGEKEWNGFSVETQGRVAFLQIDTPEGEMFDRLQNVKNAGYDVSNIYLADLTIAPYPFNILLPQHKAWLRQQMREIDPVLVFIDTLREAHEGDENNSQDMKKVINALVDVCHPAAIGLISHSRKDNAQSSMQAESDIMDEGRGSGYLPGRMDTVFRFTGRDGKGHMQYVGRSKNAQGKIPYVQDKETGLVFTNEHHAKLEQITLSVIREHSTSWSIHKMSQEISTRSGAITPRRAQDWVKKLLPMVSVKPTPDAENREENPAA